MEIYPRTAAERAMKLQEVLLRPTSGKIKWWQAAELIGISERQMRRWRKRYEEQGYHGLLDRRLRKPSSRRVPKEQAEAVLSHSESGLPALSAAVSMSASSLGVSRVAAVLVRKPGLLSSVGDGLFPNGIVAWEAFMRNLPF
jgi:hypothetical protein